jgi:hypothetical protein
MKSSSGRYEVLLKEEEGVEMKKMFQSASPLLDGLKWGTKYRFKVRGDGEWSEWVEVMTASLLLNSRLFPVADQQTFLFSWVPAAYSSKEWTLLYRASTDGFKASTFHSKCDGKAPTLIIIKSEGGNVFGGFAAMAWESQSIWGEFVHDTTTSSFLFTLCNRQGIQPTKFMIKDATKSILCYSGCGPMFGSCDIYISDSSDSIEKRYCL